MEIRRAFLQLSKRARAEVLSVLAFLLVFAVMGLLLTLKWWLYPALGVFLIAVIIAALWWEREFQRALCMRNEVANFLYFAISRYGIRFPLPIKRLFDAAELTRNTRILRPQGVALARTTILLSRDFDGEITEGHLILAEQYLKESVSAYLEKMDGLRRPPAFVIDAVRLVGLAVEIDVYFYAGAAAGIRFRKAQLPRPPETQKAASADDDEYL